MNVRQGFFLPLIASINDARQHIPQVLAEELVQFKGSLLPLFVSLSRRKSMEQSTAW
jgi:hypothetical protein